MNTKPFVNFRYIFYPFLAFLFGIVMSRGLYAGKLEVLIVTIILFLALGIYLVLRKSYKILIILFAFFFIGNGFYFIGTATTKTEYFSGTVSVVGRVTDNYKEEDFYISAVLDEVKINGKSAKNVDVTISKGYSVIKPGDRVAFESEIETVKLFTLGSFNSSHYRAGVGYTCKVSANKIVVTDGYMHIDESLRLSLKGMFYSHMSNENAAIAYGVLFGDKSGIDDSIITAFRGSGVIHVLTVSGLHVGFLMTLIYGFLKLCRANRFVNFVLTSVIMILYAALCGFAPSVVRALIMGIILMFAKVIGRRYDTLNALGLAGFIILVVSPMSAFDIGFLMSVACVSSIILLYGLLYKLFKKFMPRFVAGYIAVSLSAELGILPFLTMMFSSINLLSFSANLFIVPIFSILYPFLFISCVLCLIMPFMSFIFVPVGWVFTAITFIATFFATTDLQVYIYPLPFSVITIFFITIFAISRFTLARKLIKLLLIAIGSVALALSLIVFDLTNVVKQSVVYLHSNDDQSIVLTSSKGDRLIVDHCYINTRYLATNHYKADYYLSLGGVNNKLASYYSNNFGTTDFITLEGDSSIDSVHIIQPSELIRCDSFAIRYIEVEEIILGVSINFDDISIFVALNQKLDYNNLEKYNDAIAACSPDIVFVDNSTELAKGFLSVSSGREGATYNYQADGNLQFTFGGGKLSVRGID